MSKLVKNMLVDDLKQRLTNVNELIVVSLGRLDGQKTTQLRQSLRKKKIHLQLVKNSLARRATLNTPLAPAFGTTEGMLAIAWGGEDVVDLAKELDRVGGALEGASMDANEVKAVAKWPSRAEQLSILSGQISSMGAKLSSQIGSAGGLLAGQISSRVDDLEKAAEVEVPAA